MQLVIKSKRNGSKTVLFDDEDFDLIKNYHWCVAYTRGVFYCVASVTIDGKQRQKKMHRIIMGVDDP